MKHIVSIYLFFFFSNTVLFQSQAHTAEAAPAGISVIAPNDLNKSFTAIRNTPLILSEPSPVVTPQPVNPQPQPIPDLSTDDQYTLVLLKAALEKEFLLSASVIPQYGSPTSQGLNGKIVVFKRRQNSVFLLEATHGHVVSNDLPSQLILAEIPIVGENQDFLTLDFNNGMKKVFTMGNWYASDFQSKTYSPEEQTAATEVMHSFLQSILIKSDYLEIRQIAQVKEAGEEGDIYPSYEIRYFLSPYQPNLNFTSKELPNFKKVGFFELPPFLEKTSGRAVSHITRFDEKNPIYFYYSANTPTEYQEAVKEGILYWNKAFGKEMIKVAAAPAGVTAPDPAYNLVQWVPYDLAGFAYADALMDPRTGETLHGQAYLTSAFSFGSKARMRTLLRTLAENGVKDKKVLNVSFLGSSKMCNFHANETLQTLLENTLHSDVDDATILRISQDYVRSVTAHEVGHILGLRHNFAGNLGGNMLPPERDAVMLSYVKEGKIPLIADKRPTSSMMEYLDFNDDVIAGAQAKADLKAYDYDINAIQWGYFQTPLPESHPLFCTDTGKSLFGFSDCVTFDSGPEPISNSLGIFQNALKNLPTNFVERFILAKSHIVPDQRLTVQEVPLDPKLDAFKLVAATYGQILPWFSSTTKSLRVTRSFPFTSNLNEKEVALKNWESIKKQIQSVGTYKNALFLFQDEKESEALQKTFETSLSEYLAKDSVKNFIGADGNTHTWTQEELEYLQTMSSKYFTLYIAALQEAHLAQLANLSLDLEHKALGALDENSMSIKIEGTLFQVASQYILKQNESQLLAGTIRLGEFEPTIQVKDYFYPMSTRMAAVSILSPKIGPINGWSLEGRTKTSKVLQAQLSDQFGKSVGEINPLDITTLTLRQWFFDQMELLNEF